MTEAIPTESTVRVVAETDQWAIVELMGHVKHAGRLTEEERFGSKIGRLDIPQAVECPRCGGSGGGPDPTNACGMCVQGMVSGFRTMLFGGGSVYRIQIVSEAVARHVAKQTAGYLPVSPWDFPKQQAALPASSTEACASVEPPPPFPGAVLNDERDEDDADFEEYESVDTEF